MVTFGEAAGAYLGGLRGETRKAYAKVLEPLTDALGAATPLEDVTAGQVLAWMEDAGEDWSPATWNLRATALRSAARWMQDRYGTGGDIASALRLRKRRAVLPSEYLTPEEADALLAQPSQNAPTGIRNYALILLLIRSGLRIGEALRLRPDDLDFSAHAARLLETKSGEAQTAPWHPSADPALLRWLETRKKVLGAQRAARSPLFCTLFADGKGSKPGQPLRYDYVRMLLPRLSVKAGIGKRMHAHMLRHTFAVWALRAGLDVKTISQLLRHKSLATTAVYLASLTNGEAAGKLHGAELPELGRKGKPAQPALSREELKAMRDRLDAMLAATETSNNEKEETEP